MSFRFFLIIFFLAAASTNKLVAQKHELRLVLQGFSYGTSMVNNTNGIFKDRNYSTGFVNLGFRYRYDKYSVGIGIADLPVPLEMIVADPYFGASQGPFRFPTIPLEFGYEVAKFYKNRIAIDAYAGNYFIINSTPGLIGSGAVSGGDIGWTYQLHANRSFSILPFVGVELRQVRLKQFNVGIGYRRTFGIQQLGTANMQYSVTGQPTKNYSLENRGTGDALYISIGIRLWKK